MNMKLLGKFLLSTLLAAFSYACFYHLQPPVWSKSTTHKATTETANDSTNVLVKTATTENEDSTTLTSDGRAKFWEMIGIGSLVLAVWIWRKQLGIKGMAGMEGDDITPQPLDSPPPSKEDSAPPPETEIQSFIGGLAEAPTKMRVQAILGMFTRVHAVNPSSVARELKVPLWVAQNLLMMMRRSGILRVDGFPKTTVFTLASSMENLTLDMVRTRVAMEQNILSERRFVQVRRIYDIDSILTCETRTFIVEAKYLNVGKIGSRLDDWVMQLLNISKEFSGKPIGCILAVACKTGIDVDGVKQEVGSVTFDSGDVPVQVMVFAEDEIRRGWKA